MVDDDPSSDLLRTKLERQGNFIKDGHELERCFTEQRNDAARSSNDYDGKQERRKCFICHEKGHLRKNCPMYKAKAEARLQHNANSSSSANGSNRMIRRDVLCA